MTLLQFKPRWEMLVAGGVADRECLSHREAA